MATTRFTLDPDSVTDSGSLRLLAIALDDEVITRLGRVHAVDAGGLERCGSATTALKRIRSERFDALVCRYPLPDLLMRDFVNRLRMDGNANPGVPLLLLAIPEMMTEARRAVHRGAARAVSREARVETLHGAIHALVRSSHVENRGRVHVWVGSADRADAVEGDVVDLSSSDVVVQSEHAPPLASRGRFALKLEHMPQEVRGECEVVRHLERPSGGAAGFALRMLDFEEDGGARLAALLGT
jgi:DNA-binding NarL/FixJ family response regulator